MRRSKTVTAVVLSWLQFATATGHESPIAAAQPGAVSEVESVSVTVSDMDRAIDFYSHVLTFTPISDQKVSGPAYERLWGVPGARARIVRLALGDEQLELLALQIRKPPVYRAVFFFMDGIDDIGRSG